MRNLFEMSQKDEYVYLFIGTGSEETENQLLLLCITEWYEHLCIIAVWCSCGPQFLLILPAYCPLY